MLHEYIHTETSLRLVWLDRDEDNKTFGIAFETLPENDTGFPTSWSIRCCADRIVIP